MDGQGGTLMDLPTRRERVIVEYVIDTGEEGLGIDAKQFEMSYSALKREMRDEDGVNFALDDCFRVRAVDGEIIFSFEKRS